MSPEAAVVACAEVRVCVCKGQVAPFFRPRSLDIFQGLRMIVSVDPDRLLYTEGEARSLCVVDWVLCA